MSDTQDTSFLDEVAGDGLNSFSSKDLQIPFIWILQKGSPQVEEQNPAHVEGAKPGVFMNSLTKKIYGAELKVIPLYYEPMWLLYGANRGPFKGRKTPGSIKTFGSPFDEGGMKDIDGNSVVEAMVYYVRLVDDWSAGPAVLSLKSSDLSHCKDWNTQINTTVLASGAKAPFYSSVWNLKLEFNSNAKGTWFCLGTKGYTPITRLRYITKEEYLEGVKPDRELIMSGEKTADFALEDKSGDRLAITAPTNDEGKVEVKY